MSSESHHSRPIRTPKRRSIADPLPSLGKSPIRSGEDIRQQISDAYLVQPTENHPVGSVSHSLQGGTHFLLLIFNRLFYS
jgi:hypothetical protein